MAAEELVELVDGVLAVGRFRNRDLQRMSVKGITDAILANPDVVLRALGAQFQQKDRGDAARWILTVED